MNRTVLAGSIAMLINAPLLATEADSPAESDDKRLVITADYREKSLNELSSSITVLDEERLSQSGEQHLEEVLNQIANLNWAGGSSRPRYFQLRGVGELDQYEGAPNPSVGFLLDDIDLSGIGMVTTLFDTERFEVLRGPQSARFGANAIAGLINVKTRDPSEDAEIRTQFMLGTDDQWQTAVSASGALGEGVTGLLSHQRYEGNGFRDNPYLNKEDTNGRDETVTRVKFNIDINDDCCTVFKPFHIGFEGSRIHGHKHIGLVTRRGHLFMADMNLET